MIEEARVRVMAAGEDADAVAIGDLTTLSRYPDGGVDVVAALNVLPYLGEEEEAEFYRQARRIVGPGGWVVVSHTNELIDLVTFNRYTVEFWRERIIPAATGDVEQRDELGRILAGHLTHPEVPAPASGHRSERDFLKKRRVNPIVYPGSLTDRFGFVVEEVAFTHFHPMPPQFLEASDRYRGIAFAFEDRMKNDPLRFLFASIIMLRLRVRAC
jgi:hypothetical protein